MKTDLEKHFKIVIILIYIAAGLCGAYLVFAKLMPFLMPFVLALVFALLLNPVVNSIQDRIKIPRTISSIIVILIFSAAFISVAVLIIGELYSAAEKLVTGFIADGNFKGLVIISEEINRVFNADIDLAGSFKNLIAPAAQALVGMIKPIASGAPQVFVSVIVFILATHFMVSDKYKIIDFFNKCTNNKYKNFTTGFRRISKNSVLKYIKAQAIIMLITLIELLIGFTVFQALDIINLRYLFVIVFGIAILDALPMFGTGAILIPWAIYGVITGDFVLACSMTLLYIICLTVRQMIEPKIVGESLGMHPLITLLSMFVGLKSIGLIGMILFPIITVLAIQLYKIGVFDNIFDESKN